MVLSKLSSDDPDKFTQHDWDLVHAYTKSDGCTGVVDFYLQACVEHDFYFRTHHDFSGRVISFYEANRRFRIRIQRLSRLGLISPMSWWRWIAVCSLPQAKQAWEGKRTVIEISGFVKIPPNFRHHAIQESEERIASLH